MCSFACILIVVTLLCLVLSPAPVVASRVLLFFTRIDWEDFYFSLFASPSSSLQPNTERILSLREIHERRTESWGRESVLFYSCTKSDEEEEEDFLLSSSSSSALWRGDRRRVAPLSVEVRESSPSSEKRSFSSSFPSFFVFRGKTESVLVSTFSPGRGNLSAAP